MYITDEAGWWLHGSFWYTSFSEKESNLLRLSDIKCIGTFKKIIWGAAKCENSFLALYSLENNAGEFGVYHVYYIYNIFI